MMKKRLAGGALFGLLFVVFTYMVRTFDVAEIGPGGSRVGFSHINDWFHKVTGVNMKWYELTDKLGYLALLTVLIFALTGLSQLIRRRSLLKVDREILALGGLFVAVGAFYVLFEKVVINCRPVLMDGALEPEASYPSSHTMLFVTVIGAVMIMLGSYMEAGALRTLLRLLCLALIIVAAGGRLYSGVHWLTDIAGGLLLSIALLFFYSGAICTETDAAASGYKPKH